ncbi:unnamed protein product [Didymodactylos carnosus]|uniref:EGF-like domain-containing protein n=1 Tax=Didymodactylos carnosus TaxID=1234261 RepID=A0A814N153_9BILA|nr:unnamed protein product [Didymodactylos carnosus]CAF3852378.1 unnamed protein product [Didymodactylos carnosus]
MKSTPITILTSQLKLNAYHSFFDKWCLNDIECNTGSNCLDWRYVCDGIQHCQYGEDEFECELLEVNECDVNEYRCRNGMCIPQEWFFDSIFDCQDGSDEQRLERLMNATNKCRLFPYRSDCAERLCSSQQSFSCGDGACLRWQHIDDQQDGCANYRDLFHRCEMKAVNKLSTTENDGSCLLSSLIHKNLTEDNQCTSAFRRLLTGQEKNIQPFQKYCTLDFDFPRHSFISANVQTRYNKNIVASSIINRTYTYILNETYRRAQYYCFNGSLTCNKIVVRLDQSFCLSSIDILSKYNQWPFHYIACSKTFASLPTSHSRTSHGLWRCKSNERVISQWRINDGHIDCFNGEDELMLMSESINRRYRYRCSSSIPIQYVSTNQLGDGERNCQDGSDEISPFFNWNSQQCLEGDLHICEILRSDEKIRTVRVRFHHYCNSIWDTWDGSDEKNCTNWICAKKYIQCNKTGQCIKSEWRCDGEWDCSNGEDELNCPNNQPRFLLESKCNDTKEFFCITFDFILDPENTRPCIDYSQSGDNKDDCLGGRDERNTFWCKDDNKMLGDRFRCLNGSCLMANRVCDGIKDCEEGTDEQVCYWIYLSNRTNSICHFSKFPCLDGTCIEASNCQMRHKCSHNEHLFWCPRSNVYRATKKSSSNYVDFCMGSKSEPTRSTTGTTDKIDMGLSLNSVRNAKAKFSSLICNHGLIIETHTLNGETISCFCPPNHYGDRCQYFSRRIPLRISLDRLHRTDLTEVLHIYAFLICNQSRIVDYTQFIDPVQNSKIKHDRYLLYSRPKLSCHYSVRFEAFQSSVSNVDLLLVWEYPMFLDFLPSQRLAKILRFPLIENSLIPFACTHSICQHNGTCHVIINKQETSESYCECSSEFYGRFCENRLISTPCPCSPPAKCRSFNNEIADKEQDWFCICPEGFLPPFCKVKNPVCQSNPCMHNGTCYAHSEVGYYTCICDKHYHGARCQMVSTSIILYMNSETDLLSNLEDTFLLQLFGVRQGFTILRQQSLAHRYELPLKIFFNSQNALTELGLIHFFQREISSVTSKLYLLYANCSSETSSQFAMNILDSVNCINLMKTEKNNVNVELFHAFCRNSSNVECFYTNDYFCRCDQNLTRAECVSFHLDLSECIEKSICLNQGQCVHGDRLNKTDFACICPLCSSGKLCQYAFGRFTVTLETLLVSVRLSFITITRSLSIVRPRSYLSFHSE